MPTHLTLTRKHWALLLGIGVLGLTHAIGETQEDRNLLAKCVLSYHFHTGPSASMFLSEYVVRVEPSHSVSLWYRFGPGSPRRGLLVGFE